MNSIKEATNFIKEFMAGIKSQDNRSTASPYFYVIRTAHWVSSYHDGEGDRVVIYKDCETYGCEESEDELLEAFRGDFEGDTDEEEKAIKDMDDWDLKEWLEENDYSIYWEKHMWKEENCFLTDVEAKEHLKLNYYHYSSDAHTYVKHFWRAPQVHKLFDALNVIAGI